MNIQVNEHYTVERIYNFDLNAEFLKNMEETLAKFVMNDGMGRPEINEEIVAAVINAQHPAEYEDEYPELFRDCHEINPSTSHPYDFPYYIAIDYAFYESLDREESCTDEDNEYWDWVDRQVEIQKWSE